MLSSSMTRRSIAELVLRAGVAFAFLYPSINAFIDPSAWVGYFPSFMRGIVSDGVLLSVFGIVELVIGLWILSGKKILIPALAASAMLIAIVAFNIQEMQVVFRDLSIAAAALYLALTHASSKMAHTSTTN